MYPLISLRSPTLLKYSSLSTSHSEVIVFNTGMMCVS